MSIAISFLAGAISLAVATASPVSAATADVPSTVQIMNMGSQSMLTTAKGLTLYVFDNDTDGKSTCNGKCATNRPPLAATKDAKPVGAFTVITRDDGTKQWAYKSKPLYTYKNDKNPMDETGAGLGGKWHVATL